MADELDVLQKPIDATKDVEAFWADNKELLTVEKFKSLLNEYRFEWSDEIPSFKVNSTTPAPDGYKGYKVRDGWFNHIAFTVEDGFVCGLIPPELIADTQQFLRFIKYIKTPLQTTKEDLDFANSFLDKVLLAIGE